MVKFKNFSRPLSVFPVLFKANLIFKDFSRQFCIFKYFSSLCEPCQIQNGFIGGLINSLAQAHSTVALLKA